MKRSESPVEVLRERVARFGYGGTAIWARMKEYDLRMRLGAPIPDYMRPPAPPAPEKIEVVEPVRVRPQVPSPFKARMDARPAVREAPEPDAPMPRKPAPPVTDQDRRAVLLLVESCERPMSRSLMLCRLRGFDRAGGWNLDRLERTLADLTGRKQLTQREHLYSLV